MSNFFLNLFKQLPPETAHQLTIYLLKLKLNKAVKKADDSILNQRLLGIDFSNPVGLAAGFDKNAEVIVPMLNYGFGFVEVGTITPHPQEGNKKPRIFRLNEDLAIINHLGFNNKGSLKALEKLKVLNNNQSFQGIVGINIGKNINSTNAIDDYLYCLENIGCYGSYITINISSPNTPGLRDLQLRGQIENLVKKIKKKQTESELLIEKPIFVKISPDLEDEQLRDIALMALANNIDGLVISNSTIKRPNSLISENKNEIGGLSGKPLFVDSTITLKKIYTLTNGQIPLIGVGGISTGSECYEKIKSGASLVQLYTALIYQGPKVIAKIKEELVDLIKTDGYKNIKDVVGKSV